MLVDTGANVTLVRTDLAQKLKGNFIYTAPNISLKTATGEKAEIHGKLDAAIECGSRKFQHKIYVADITDPCILGLDFLQKFNFMVDLEKNEIRTGGEEIPLFSARAEDSKLCSVLAKEKIIIPARSECLIQGVPEASGKFRYAVTDFPSQVSQKGVLVAATLVDLKKEAIPVRVLNLDHKPKTIDKGAVIATCEPVVDIVARPQGLSESLHLPSILENLEGLNEEQRTAVKELLQEFQNLFSTSDSDVGRCNMTQHRINTGNHPPIKQYPRRLPLAKKEEAERLVKGRFVRNFSAIARPLHKLTEARSNFNWTEECEKSFNSLKQALITSPVLTYPRTDKEFILDTDASNEGIGAVLSQKIGNEECVIAYFSKSLGKPERNYCVTRKELLAIVKSIEHFHHYLYGRKFLLRTDHASLRWLLNFREPEGQIARWIQRLQEYDFEIQHRKGTSHGNADALSRRPCKESCKHCTNAEKKFGMETAISVKVLTTEDVWSSSEVQKAQLEDPAIKPILERKLNSEDRPSWQEIAPESPATKRYWALWDSLHLKDGVLYRKWESDDGSSCRWQLILPKSRIQEVLRETHDSASGGHFGVMKTLSKTRERFYWDRLRADVEKWCRECHACGARKGPKTRTKGRLQRYNVGAPFERMALDILGPLPVTAKGNRYVLVLMDYFTKWPEAIPIPDQEASTVAEELVRAWISRYGVPMILHSDQGTNFNSALFTELCKLLGILKTRTTALHPESDGMVERFNRTILNHLSLFVSKNQTDWDTHLPLFLLAYRSADHEATGCTPADMLFGRTLRLPCDILFGRPSDTPSSPNEYLNNLEARLESVHAFARERIKLASERMKTRYDSGATGHHFKEGDQVWMYNPKRRRGLSPKLQQNWEGPYTIVKKLNDVIYRVQRSPNAKPKVIHINRLTPYRATDHSSV
ncbi:Transposon Ty3-I Gag-Pol polyprotein [Araneus ventricosus]|uniref:RNA-directed DNA polymerase n=1 Tax=Araneus ventricosus TaxID=182803 RepID=A0A4Y2IAX1_ARAVE|nr:Transposon Ty3-I Gag-Pol polyprotein [Araneus ventricosus]GBM74855.1 Transposon Ty3-I Gag-Pol polyprotein [Araneus ventricosus]